MSDVFVLNRYEDACTEEILRQIVEGTAGCYSLYGVEWRESFLSMDGRRLVCRFDAPDAEAARLAFDKEDSAQRVLWAGTIHTAPGAAASPDLEANVLVERSFAEPREPSALQEIEDSSAWCLEAHGVEAVRSFSSLDRRHMICLYRAPDAESVRLAQRQARMPLEDVWSFRHLTP